MILVCPHLSMIWSFSMMMIQTRQSRLRLVVRQTNQVIQYNKVSLECGYVKRGDWSIELLLDENNNQPAVDDYRVSTPEHDFDLFEDYWEDDVSTTAIDDQVNDTDGSEEQSDDDVSQSHSDHQSTSQRRSTRVVGKPVKTYVYEHQFSESDSQWRHRNDLSCDWTDCTQPRLYWSINWTVWFHSMWWWL